MSQASARPRTRERHLILNGDGKRHPWIATAAAYAVVAGLASFILGMLTMDHLAGTILGLTGFVIGLWAQMLSATRGERVFIIFGVVASFVGMGLGFAHGGFS